MGTQDDSSGSSTAEDRAWSEAVALEYDVDELEAMCVWLDTNIALSQSRIEVVTNRIGIVFAVDGIALSVLLGAATKVAWPLTVIASMLAALSMLVAASGVRTERLNDRDPTTMFDTMWGSRLPGEVQAVLYRRRSVVYRQQKRLLDARVPALMLSSWIAMAAVAATGAAAFISRVA